MPLIRGNRSLITWLLLIMCYLYNSIKLHKVTLKTSDNVFSMGVLHVLKAINMYISVTKHQHISGR